MTPAILNPVDTKPNTFPISVGGASERINMSRDGDTMPEKNPEIRNKNAIISICIGNPAIAKNISAMAIKHNAANK